MVHINSGCNQCRIVRTPRADTHTQSPAVVAVVDDGSAPDALMPRVYVYISADGCTAYTVCAAMFLGFFFFSFVQPKQWLMVPYRRFVYSTDRGSPPWVTISISSSSNIRYLHVFNLIFFCGFRWYTHEVPFFGAILCISECCIV
jgi:hypothetical protein